MLQVLADTGKADNARHRLQASRRRLEVGTEAIMTCVALITILLHTLFNYRIIFVYIFVHNAIIFVMLPTLSPFTQVCNAFNFLNYKIVLFYI